MESPQLDEQKAPRIVFDHARWDTGAIHAGEKIKHRFAFRNDGSAPLRIESVSKTCGCTKAYAERTVIVPGESGAIRATYKAGWKRGPVTESIFVASNDPGSPKVKLTIVGDIKIEVEVIPRGFYLGVMTPGQIVQRTLQVRPLDVPSFRITEIHSDSEAISAGVPQPVKGEGYVVPLTFTAPAEEGRLQAVVTVLTDMEHAKKIDVAVYGRVAEGK